MGLCNYYRRFVLGFAKIAKPLHSLTLKGVDFVWGDAQQRAFDTLKQRLVAAPCLCIFDPTLRTRICSDASQTCMGAMLEQLQEDD